MANAICQHCLGRDLDESRDGLRSLGQYAVNGVRCQFVLDIGPLGVRDPVILSPSNGMGRNCESFFLTAARRSPQHLVVGCSNKLPPDLDDAESRVDCAHRDAFLAPQNNRFLHRTFNIKFEEEGLCWPLHFCARGVASEGHPKLFWVDMDGNFR